MLSERRFVAVMASIYEAGADFRCWPDTLRLIAQAYNAPTVVFGKTSQDVRIPGSSQRSTRRKTSVISLIFITLIRCGDWLRLPRSE